MDNGFVELEIREGETRLYNWKLNMFTWGLSYQIGFDSIGFLIEKLQKPLDLIQYWFNSKKLFDSIQICLSSHEKKTTIRKLANPQREYSPKWQKWGKISYVIPFCEIFIFYCHNSLSCSCFCPDRIEFYWKSQSIWSAYDSIPF
jgi:hypothetical protein